MKQTQHTWFNFKRVEVSVYKLKQPKEVVEHEDEIP